MELEIAAEFPQVWEELGTEDYTALESGLISPYTDGGSTPRCTTPTATEPGTMSSGPQPLVANEQQPANVQEALQRSKVSWMRNADVFDLLTNHNQYGLPVSREPPLRPPGGSVFLFDRTAVRFFRKDGFVWRKKPDGRTVRETHEKLKVNDNEALHCYYAHTDPTEGIQRRCYWLTESEEDIVLVHYLQLVSARHTQRAAAAARAAAEAGQSTGGATDLASQPTSPHGVQAMYTFPMGYPQGSLITAQMSPEQLAAFLAFQQQQQAAAQLAAAGQMEGQFGLQLAMQGFGPGGPLVGPQGDPFGQLAVALQAQSVSGQPAGFSMVPQQEAGGASYMVPQGPFPPGMPESAAVPVAPDTQSHHQHSFSHAASGPIPSVFPVGGPSGGPADPGQPFASDSSGRPAFSGGSRGGYKRAVSAFSAAANQPGGSSTQVPAVPSRQASAPAAMANADVSMDLLDVDLPQLPSLLLDGDMMMSISPDKVPDVLANYPFAHRASPLGENPEPTQPQSPAHIQTKSEQPPAAQQQQQQQQQQPASPLAQPASPLAPVEDQAKDKDGDESSDDTAHRARRQRASRTSAHTQTDNISASGKLLVDACCQTDHTGPLLYCGAVSAQPSSAPSLLTSEPSSPRLHSVPSWDTFDHRMQRLQLHSPTQSVHSGTPPSNPWQQQIPMAAQMAMPAGMPHNSLLRPPIAGAPGGPAGAPGTGPQGHVFMPPELSLVHYSSDWDPALLQKDLEENMEGGPQGAPQGPRDPSAQQGAVDLQPPQPVPPQAAPMQLAPPTFPPSSTTPSAPLPIPGGPGAPQHDVQMQPASRPSSRATSSRSHSRSPPVSRAHSGNNRSPPRLRPPPSAPTITTGGTGLPRPASTGALGAPVGSPLGSQGSMGSAQGAAPVGGRLLSNVSLVLAPQSDKSDAE